MQILRLGFWILFVIFNLSFVIPSNGATWLDPKYDWKTTETAHFSIHYPKYLEKIAEDFAPDAEGVHRRLSPLFQHVPSMKTNVVLVDNYDIGNGWTSVIPNPLITLYITDIDSNLHPYSYREWLKYVFIHEYTHLLHLDTLSGGSILTRLIFGRVLFPNTLNPGFILEGLAVYMESHYGKGGRIFNPWFEAQMRMDVLENNIKTIDQAAVTTIKWPGRSLWYVYGAYFIEYLADKYGEDKLFRLSQEYGDFILYDGIDNCYKVIFGKNLGVLWKEWLEYMRIKYSRQREDLAHEGLTGFDQLTSSGFYNLQPTWAEDSQSLYFTERDFDQYPHIKKIDLVSRKESSVIESTAFDENMDVHGNKMVFSKGKVFNNNYYYKDLYLMDLSSRKIERLSNGFRAADPNFSPDGRKIVFTKLNQGARSLWILELETKDMYPLIDGKPDVSYFSPVFSPDGRKIAAAKWVEGDQSIYLIDIETRQEIKLTSHGLCGNPAFSPDGQFVLFNSDASGVTNIYGCRLKDKKIFQATNVLGIALMPAVSPDGKKLAYVNYSSRGYDLAVIPFGPENWRMVEAPPPPPQRFAEEISPRMVSTRKTAYNPVPALLPKFWMPFSVADENGRHTSIFTTGMDSLQHHVYQAEVSYNWTADRPIYQAAYYNNQFFPQISLLAIDYPIAYSWNSGATTYWERYLNQSIYFSFPDRVIFKDYDAQAFVFGFENINISNISSLGALTTQPARGNIRGVGLGYRYLSSRSYPASISQEDGIDIFLTTKMYSKDLGSDFDFTNYIVSSNQYLPLPPKHHVLAFSETGFLSIGDQLPQSDFTWRYLSLRGYPSTFLLGTKGGLVSAQYRFPISYIEKGLSYGYTFFDRVYGTFFLEAGGATFGSYSNMFWNKSIGGEISLSTISAFGFAPLIFTLGYARGLDSGGESKIYFSLSGSGVNMTIGEGVWKWPTQEFFKN